MKVLTFGKHKNEMLEMTPESYIKWLATHKNVLSVENRGASDAAKELLQKKEEKAMLNAVRSEYCGEFDWQESLKDTVLANREQGFTVDEMYAALESICKAGEDLDSKERVARRLEGLSERTCQIKLEKVSEQTYKFAYVG